MRRLKTILEIEFRMGNGECRLHYLSNRLFRRDFTHIVSNLKGRFHGWFHPIVLHGHEQRIDNNAQCDEQINKRVHYEEFNVMSKYVPPRTAFPAKQQLVTLGLHKLFLVHALLEPEQV